MAEQHAVSAGGYSDNDYAEHEKTYRLFLALFKYGTLGAVLVLILLAILTL
ncbi:MAG: aa3-type cytochrome c oxidase subunit IV [Beijerinckiaceae bacterium]